MTTLAPIQAVVSNTDGLPTPCVQMEDVNALPPPPALVLIGVPAGFRALQALPPPLPETLQPQDDEPAGDEPLLPR